MGYHVGKRIRGNSWWPFTRFVNWFISLAVLVCVCWVFLFSGVSGGVVLFLAALDLSCHMQALLGAACGI